MIDPTIFDGYEERLEAAYDKPRRWCKCGHVEGVHWKRIEFVSGCHYQACKCTEFRSKKRMNKFKYWLTGRG